MNKEESELIELLHKQLYQSAFLKDYKMQLDIQFMESTEQRIFIADLGSNKIKWFC